MRAPRALLHSLLFGLLLAGMASAPAAAQISPGPLAKAHQPLEGNGNCTRCHGGGNEGMSARCASCHKEIGWLSARGRGIHGRPEVKGATCASCHPDHAGRDFALVTWSEGSEARFDHRRAGWPLVQSHAQARCADCHATKYQRSPAAGLAPGGTPARWAGLEPGCASCHEDVHRGALKADCTACHDAGEWKVTPGFSHDSTAYPLAAKHREVACDDCHLAARLNPRKDPAGQPIPVYRPVSSTSCASCHRDVHAGRLGPNCAGCHSTRGFREIDRDNFDHDRTKYPLDGRHAAVRCAGCHGRFATAAEKTPAFRRCTDCHADQHGGVATLAGRPADCAACHGLAGFTPATFAPKDHQATRYPLEGKHTRASCASCHRKDTSAGAAARLGPSRVIMRPAFAACRDCHADDHGGQLAGAASRGACAECHTVAGWTPSSVSVADHATLGLALEGRHAEMPCRGCHGAERKGLAAFPAAPALGKARFRFALMEKDCAACHVDPHAGRFARGGARPKASGCAACHDAARFRPATAGIAAHADFGFALGGAHAATPCVACHAELKGAAAAPASSLRLAGTRFPALKFEAPKVCADCHETVHGTQFNDRADAGRCDACHGDDRFVPATRFDHERATRFPLKGGHEGVACNRCHPSDLAARDPRRLVYRPVSGKCESCHREVKP